MTTHALLGILRGRIPSDNGTCYRKAFRSLPSPPHFHYSQVPDHDTGSSCHCTLVVDMSNDCGCFHLLSHSIKLAAAASKALREYSITPYFGPNPLDSDRLCDLDSPAFCDQTIAIETERQDWAICIVFDWRPVRTWTCMPYRVADVSQDMCCCLLSLQDVVPSMDRSTM